MPIAIRQAALELRDLTDSQLDDALAVLDPDELAAVAECWQLIAHPYQLRPADASIWLMIGGRAIGKTRGVAEQRLDRAEDHGANLLGLLGGKTVADVRDVMIEGESGIIACARRRGYSARYVANRGVVEHPSGARWHIVTAEKPDKPRGYQSNDVWIDEIAACQNAIAFLDNILFGHRLRVGGVPIHCDITTTPKPNAITRRLVLDPRWRDRVRITRGITDQNRANLAPEFLATLDAVYKGTKLGQQELLGILLDGTGSIVDQDTIHKFRLRRPPELARKIVSLDPSITAKEDSDDAGIIVVGTDGHDAFVLDDRTIGEATFSAWARETVRAYVEHDADAIVAEVNQGGGGIVEALKAACPDFGIDPDALPVHSVWARESKKARAEPVGALYERGRVHHVDHLPELEAELTGWYPGEPSPNRMDALVHGVTHLLLGDKRTGSLWSYL